MNGFSAELRDRCVDLHGIDPEVSLRQWLRQLTRKRGVALELLVHDGAQEGRRIEEEEGTMPAEPGVLSKSEVRVLDAISETGSTKDAAALLGLSEWTVYHHMKAVRSKLGVHTAAQAVRVAIRTGQMAA